MIKLSRSDDGQHLVVNDANDSQTHDVSKVRSSHYLNHLALYPDFLERKESLVFRGLCIS